MSPASAEGVPVDPYATVTEHKPFSSAANKVSFWCKEEGGRKISPGGPSWVVDGNYSQVIVKAGSGQYANTVFASPIAGQIVWADTNGDKLFNPGGPGGDKGISHIILCDGTAKPETTDLVVEKVWRYGEGVPDGFELDETDAGPLNVRVNEKETGQGWGQTVANLPVLAVAKVSEGSVKDPESPAGYTCTIEGAPLYEVNGVDKGTTAPTFPLAEEGNTVVVTNSVDCIEKEKPTTTLTVLKQWVPGNGVPSGYPKLDSKNAGALKVTVNGDPTGQSWDEVKAGLPIGGSAVVSETKPTLPPLAGYECTVSNPTYVINGGSAADTAEFKLLAEPNTVTVVNSFNCTAIIIPPPPTTSITVTKAWVYVGAPAPATNPTPGALTVTVGGTATGQAWSATTSGHTVGATATVTEGAVTPPPLAGFTCTADAPSYAVNGGTATTTAPSFALIAAPNTVTVTNTVRCALLPVVEEVEEEEVVDAEEDVVEEKSAVAGSEDELADTGADLTGGLGAILILAGAALIAARRFATK